MTLGTLVLGLINGLIIGLLAVGFVLVYKANRFLNLAHAQLGALSAILLAKFCNDWHWNWWLAFTVCTAVGVVTGLVVERFLVAVVRRRSTSPVRLLILTIGVSDLLLALTFLPGLTPHSQAPYPQPFTSHVEVGGVVLTGMSVLTVIAVPVLLLVLTIFLERTSLGRQIRAAASNPEAARLCGISTSRVSLIAWGIAGGLAALAAVLNGPTTANFNAEAFGPYLLMLTLGAAAVGAFVSLPAAVLGGLALGVVYQFVLEQTKNAGTAELALFGAILFVILVRGRAIGRAFAVVGAAVPDLPGLRVPSVLKGSGSVRWWPRVLLFGALLVAVVFPRLPYFSQSGNQFLLVLVLVYALLGVSLTTLVGWAGQVSMGHFAIVGIGAFLTARWAGQAGWNVVALLVVTGAAGALVAVLIGLPALRVPGLTLAVATLGFAVIAPDWLLQQHLIGGSTPFTTFVEPTTVLPGLGHVNSQLDLYYLVLAVLVVTVVAVRGLRRSAAGRVIIAVRDNERASGAFGINPASVKIRILALSGFIAAASGVFWAMAWQSISPSQFPASASIALLALPVVGGLGSLSGVVAATVMLYMGTFFVGPHVSGLFGSIGENEGFLLFVAGLGVVGAMLAYPNGIAGVAQGWWQRQLNRRAARLSPADDVFVSTKPAVTSDEVFAGGSPAIELPGLAESTPVEMPNSATSGAPAISERSPLSPGNSALIVRDVTVHFGGIVALQDVGMRVEQGEIVGLIGPNGAGKTTLMNVISGLQRPRRGSVRLYGHEMVHRPPYARSEYGMARSFQDASLFAGLTLTETVQVALVRRRSRPLIPTLVGWPRTRSAEKLRRARAEELLRAFGLDPWATALTSELSTGMRRISDLMAQVATQPRLLLLDEPTAGVAQREAEAFGPLILRIRDSLGCGILIIEHDMPLLMDLCDRVYAMEAGRVVSEGTPEAVRYDPKVIASYLGTNPTAMTRSGAAIDRSPVSASTAESKGESR
jgi:ABC-type branched-subunit amino acid transport system ATPase component/ABC-type branched-subunit amino acid transport system permease subunit